MTDSMLNATQICWVAWMNVTHAIKYIPYSVAVVIVCYCCCCCWNVFYLIHSIMILCCTFGGVLAFFHLKSTLYCVHVQSFFAKLSLSLSFHFCTPWLIDYKYWVNKTNITNWLSMNMAHVSNYKIHTILFQIQQTNAAYDEEIHINDS